MEFNRKTQVVKSFVRDMKNEKYNMFHKLQRKEGQWSTYEKSLLIDSMLRNYPVDPIRSEEKEDKIKYVFDGVQRSTSIRDFLADKYKLSSKLKPVEIDGAVYEIAGKKFSQLDPVVQDKITDYEVVHYIFSDCTDEDIREMFKRQNGGKPLSNTQKRKAIENDRVNNIIFDLANHPFFDKVLSPAQLKKDVANDIVRQTLMLINTTDEHDFTSFRAKDIDAFVTWYNSNNDDTDVDILKSAMSFLDEKFEKLNIKSTSIPMMLYSAYECVKNQKDFDKFAEIVQIFIDNYGTDTEYVQYCTSGTTSAQAVQGRFNYWKNLCKDL
nr:DUF262 domain-containing protein [uncultured Lachnoclostridium sp.]